MSSSSAVTQQRKVALIIGNQNYQQLPKLQVTLKDGEAVNELLKKLGFETHLFLDQTKKQMNSEINEFGNEIIQENDLVFFYYSGHGGQFFRDYTVHNVLCGIDATTNHDGVSLATILTRYFQKKSVYFIILDECQSFPKTLEECITKSKGGSSALQEIPLITSAMPQIPRGKEVEILFACKPDKGAFEEQEQNLGHIVRALQDVVIKVDRWDDVNKYIIKQVKEETDNRQTPVVQSSITQPLYIRQVNAQLPQSDPAESSNLNIPSSSVAIAPLLPPQIHMTLQDAIQIFEAQGKLENARIKLTDNLFMETHFGSTQIIRFKYPGKSLSFKNVTFEYPKETELPAFIVLVVKHVQQVEVENCSFHGVGLRVGGYGDGVDASITNSTFTDIKSNGLEFYNMRSVQVSEVGVENCEDTSVYCCQVREFVGKKMDIQNSDTGFWFYQCRYAQLELHDVNIQNCKNPIKLIESDNIEQHNVNIIS